ncbi:hypothetical protein H1R20_g12720, partial [Candolleomyces eurysporus]
MSSPALDVSLLLSTDDPLSSEEKQHARLQIATLNKRLDDLRLLCRQIEREVEEYHSLLSPWRGIPVEIVGTIFKFVIPPVRAVTAKDLGNLRLVCKKWRDVADLTPQLWSGLEIDVRGRQLSHEKLSSWLNKAGDLRRTLVVPCSAELRTIYDHPALCRILAQGPTVNTLAISCLYPTGFDDFTKKIQSCAAEEEIPSRWHSIPSLTLSFQALLSPGPTPAIFPASLTSLAITVRDLVRHPLRGVILGFIYPPVFEQLVDFNFNYQFWDILGLILPAVRHCVNAEMLTIIGEHQYRQAPTLQAFFQQGHNGEGIHLPKLKTLRLGGRCSSPIPLTLEAIQAPNLVHLDVDLSFVSAASFTFQEECRRSRCTPGNVLPSTIPAANLACRASLRQLRIRSAVVPYPDVVLRIVINLPSLVHLTLDDIVVDRNIDLGGMSMEDREDHVPLPLGGWPRIEVLELLGRSKDHFANSRIMELLAES